MKKVIFKNVDAYIAAASNEAQAKLEQMRKIVKAVAPKAEESISYDMPHYRYHGGLIAFAAWKTHIGVYMGVVEEYKDELKGYIAAKGTLRFPLDKPLPVALIRKLVRARLKENEARMKNI